MRMQCLPQGVDSAQCACAAFSGGGTYEMCVCSVIRGCNVHKVRMLRIQEVESAQGAYAAFFRGWGVRKVRMQCV